MDDRNLNVVGVISYEDYSLQISSEHLKRVVRGEKLHKICGLPEIFSGGLIHGGRVVPVLSRKSLDLYIATILKSNDSASSDPVRGGRSPKKAHKLLFALVACDGYDFALPLDEVVSIFDDCQKDMTDSAISGYIALECRGLLDYILLQKGVSNEV